MDLLNLTVEGWILVLRIALVVIVYLFLLFVIAAARREWRSAAVSQPDLSLGAAPRLVVINNGQNNSVIPGQVYPLAPLTTIGRSDDNTLALNDTFVSTQHASLALRDDGWWIEDLGSRNGTYLNRKQIPKGQPAPVQYGDEIQIGNIVMKMTR